jgi:hypothetical protein
MNALLVGCKYREVVDVSTWHVKLVMDNFAGNANKIG